MFLRGYLLFYEINDCLKMYNIKIGMSHTTVKCVLLVVHCIKLPNTLSFSYVSPCNLPTSKLYEHDYYDEKADIMSKFGHMTQLSKQRSIKNNQMLRTSNT